MAFSCTVSYGPTTSCFVTWTPPGAALASAEPELSEAAPKPELRLLHCGAAGQLTGGATMLVRVMPSSVWKTMSALRPTVTVPEIGRTQANDEGLPWYLIWS